MPPPRQSRVHGPNTRAVRVPVHRVTPYAQTGPAVGKPAKNDTGAPVTPSSGDAHVPTAPDAADDTETMPWNESWDDSGKPKTTPEDTADTGRIETETEDGKPHEQPGLDESTKATQIKKGSGVTIDHISDTAPVPLSEKDSTSDSAGGLSDVTEDLIAKSKTQRIDNPPSPADVPEDMKYDPGGEAVPGMMPPDPAPVPGTDDDAPVKKGASSDSLITPLGNDDDD